MIAVIYVIATGFVAAGLLDALHKAMLVRQEDGNASAAVVLSFETPLDKVWSLIMCTFAGPYYLIRYGTRFWLQGMLPGSALCVCLLLGAVWSFFSGVVLVELTLFLSTFTS